MRKLKIIAAEIVTGSCQWLVLTFQDHPKQLCVKFSNGCSLPFMRHILQSASDTSELVGKELLLAEIPSRSRDYLVWEPIPPAHDGEGI